jgi:hypothetical protein
MMKRKKDEKSARAQAARALLEELSPSPSGNAVRRDPEHRNPPRKSLPSAEPKHGGNARPTPPQPLKRNANVGGAAGQHASVPKAAVPAVVGIDFAADEKDVAGVIVIDPNAADLAEKHRPKKHAPGALKFMDVVFYRNPPGYADAFQRLFIEAAPPNWKKTAWVRVTDRPLRQDRDMWPTDRVSFCCHADMLDLAPPVKNVFHSRLPTVASVAAKERAKTGQRDVGDEIATTLRNCKTLDDVYREAADYLEVAEADLRGKYGHLNPGQQRMNLGNRMRSKFRKSQQQK